MSPFTVCIVSCAALLVLMPVAGIYGHRVGRRWLSTHPDASELSTGTVDAAVLSLLGLLTAFTFSSAYSRFENRRQLIVDETNAIGTAYLRLDLLPAERQSSLRQLFRDYAQSRYKLWEALNDRRAALAEIARSEELQNAIWTAAIEATERETGGDARKLLLPALNEMIDITTTRLIAIQAHPPIVIFLLLGFLSLAAAWIVGFGMAKCERPSYLHLFGFAVIGSTALSVILDIEYPRYGFVRLDEPHQLLTELEQKM